VTSLFNLLITDKKRCQLNNWWGIDIASQLCSLHLPAWPSGQALVIELCGHGFDSHPGSQYIWGDVLLVYSGVGQWSLMLCLKFPYHITWFFLIVIFRNSYCPLWVQGSVINQVSLGAVARISFQESRYVYRVIHDTLRYFGRHIEHISFKL